MIRKAACFVMVLVLAVFGGCSLAENGQASGRGLPELNQDGFLDSGEFVYENGDEGYWYYVSATLRVEVKRTIQAKPART